LPNVLVSCGGQGIAELSGWQLAGGTEIGSGYSAQTYSGDASLFLIPLGALLILLIAFIASKRKAISKVLDGFFVLVIGAIPLILAWTKFTDLRQQAMSSGIQVELEYGFWGMVIGFGLVVIGGIVNFGGDKTETINNSPGSG